MIVVASPLGTLDPLGGRIASRVAQAAENCDAVDALVTERRQVVHDGRAERDGYGTWLNIPSKVVQVAAVRDPGRRRDLMQIDPAYDGRSPSGVTVPPTRAVARERRAADLAENKLSMSPAGAERLAPID